MRSQKNERSAVAVPESGADRFDLMMGLALTIVVAIALLSIQYSGSGFVLPPQEVWREKTILWLMELASLGLLGYLIRRAKQTESESEQ